MTTPRSEWRGRRVDVGGGHRRVIPGSFRAEMSRENIELVERYIDAFNRRDLDTLDALNDPDMELDWSASRGVDAAVYRGADAVMGFYAEWFALFEQIAIKPESFIESGESIVVPSRSRFTGRDGLELATHAAGLLTVRDRRIVLVRLYQEVEQALADLERPQ
jgi:ketosteroid isomerase-like protein